MASAPASLSLGPLSSTLEVAAFVALSGMTWFNGAELLVTIFLTFKRWTGKYFFCLVVATLGVLVYQINVFMMIFATHLNAYGIVASIGLGWSAMVTGQSLVLWSRLHLVCRSRWKLRLILCMIIINGTSMHGPQFIFSLLAIKNNAINPTYKPFEVMEKISVAILTTQEVIISVVYLAASIRILHVGEALQRKKNRRRIKLLLLANVLIICIDICTITLEFLALWGIWCSFKGFAYSVKLKIEFAILNQLRESVKGSREGESYDIQNTSSKVISLRSRDHNTRASGQPGILSLKRNTFEQIPPKGHIERTTEINVSRHERSEPAPKDSHISEVPRIHHSMSSPPSDSSSEVEFASRGV